MLTVAPGRRALDAIDRTLVTLLQRDGRTSYATLARAAGVSGSAARRRVRRLVAEGVVRFMTVADPLVCGSAGHALIGLRTVGDPRCVAAALGDLPPVRSVAVCAGGSDVLAEVWCSDDDQLIALLDGHIRTIEGVSATLVFVYLEHVTTAAR